jgi:hypothetical protein
MARRVLKYSILLIVVLIVGYIGSNIYKIYIPGCLSSIKTVSVENITSEGNDIKIELSSIDSSLVFKPYVKEVEDNTMTLKIYKGFRINDSEHCEATTIEENIEGIDKIILSDNLRQEIIWEREGFE